MRSSQAGVNHCECKHSLFKPAAHRLTKLWHGALGLATPLYTYDAAFEAFINLATAKYKLAQLTHRAIFQDIVCHWNWGKCSVAEAKLRLCVFSFERFEVMMLDNYFPPAARDAEIHCESH